MDDFCDDSGGEDIEGRDFRAMQRRLESVRKPGGAKSDSQVKIRKVFVMGLMLAIDLLYNGPLMTAFKQPHKFSSSSPQAHRF